MSDLEAQLKVAFREELAAGVGQMETAIAQAQESPPEKLPELFTQIFSVSHMLKGAARAVGLSTVESICGRMETLFYRLQSGSVLNADGLGELTQACIAYLAHSMDQTPPSPEEATKLVAGLDKILSQETPTGSVPDELRREIAQTFFVESEESLTQLRRLFSENDTLATEDQVLPQEEIEDAFRKAHTLKGGARLIEYHSLENQAHALEEILSQLKSGAIHLETAVLAKITKLLDGIEGGLVTEQEKLAGLGPAEATPTDMVTSIEEMAASLVSPADEVETPPFSEDELEGPPLPEMPGMPELTVPQAVLGTAETPDRPVPAVAMASTTPAPTAASTLRVVPIPAPPVSAHPSLQKLFDEFRPPTPPPHRNHFKSAAAPARSEAVKIQLENLDPLYRAVVALHLEVQAQNQVSDSLRNIAGVIAEIRHDWEGVKKSASAQLRKLSMNEQTSRISHYFDLIGKQTRDLRVKCEAAQAKHRKSAWDLNILAQKLKRDVRRIYTVPASSVFFGFRKMVSDISMECQKEVNLVTIGLDVEADRTVLQGLKEPVLHIVRNSVFHGIESPEAREQNGKSRQGTITLKLTKETSSLCAEVFDDGGGIAFEKIRHKAVAQGRFKPDEAAKKTEADLIDLIFQPGFSTADDVNAIAGRGVGLSAVRKALEEIGGKLEVTSKAGRGCRFLLRIPLHVSTQPLILFQVQKKTFAIPVAGVARLLRVPHDSIKEVGGRQVATTAEGQLLFKPMREVLGGTIEPASIPKQWSGMVIQNEQQRVFIAVDTFVGHRDAVIKKLGRIGESWDLICGGVLLEDGKLALVVDPRTLAKQVLGGESVAQKAKVSGEPTEAPDFTAKRILVVDDSITTRTLEKSILETYGFHVELAVDGADALMRLRRECFDLVVTDLEMPRLNGFELVQAMKTDEKLNKIPIIMVTSVENPKDRERGMAHGADAYVVKKKFDQQELLQTIRQFL